jgi:RHS repeat-associated protein
VDCIDEAYASAQFEAEQLYNAMLNDLVNELLGSINCMSGIVEDYTVTYEIKEYQYTLYYYDLAGNLTSTVPPLGVHPLDQTEFNAAYNYNTHHWTQGNNPDHELQTIYTYNGANQLVQQFTPDSDTTNYFYDDLFRLRFSQNAQQLIDDKFSYTIYDELGRITEAGEAGDPSMGPQNFTAQLNNYAYPLDTLKRDYMKTYYEEGYEADPTIAASFTDGQQNLRNRIGAVEQRMAQYNVVANDLVVIEGTQVYLITSYSYDFHGNVKELVQTNTDLEEHGQQHKLMTYEYDLISGNVKEMHYQKDSMDEWNHRYHYDANNRLVRAWTSDDCEEWEMDAKYFYYLHGSLARVETGHDKVQGTDYAYNMQGWLKGANSTTLNASRDMGQDAHTSGLDKYSGSDVYGFELGYFDNDYDPIAGTAFANTDALISANGSYGNLYNGNITQMVTAMKDDNEDTMVVLGNIYKYDQLQRIKSMDAYSLATQSTYLTNNSFAGATLYGGGNYRERYWFDKNGNLDSLERYDNTNTLMDDFSYNYHGTKKNRLTSVDDGAGSGVSTVDVDDQNANNYTYNAIGQLTSDTQEDIDLIEWTVTGKVRKVTQGDATETEFIYDAMGNRVMKIEEGINEISAVYTYYVYDAAGNIISTYTRTVNAFIGGAEDYRDQLKLSERIIYGSKRVGVKNENREMTRFEFTPTSLSGTGFYQAYSSETGVTEYPQNFAAEKREVGEKHFEFGNHLGNVLEVTTDRKIGNVGETAYEADVISYTDFSPFGMVMPGRNGSTSSYDYGFQGSEKDDEIKGECNSYTTHFRQYDPRLGRWLSIDPVVHPWESPYVFSYNNPISFNDPLGNDPPRKGGFWHFVGNYIAGSWHENRALNYAYSLGIDESQVYYLDNNTTVVVNARIVGHKTYAINLNGHSMLYPDLDQPVYEYTYSVFRRLRKNDDLISWEGGSNDDVNLTQAEYEALVESGDLYSEGVVDVGLPGIGAAAKGSQMIYAGARGITAYSFIARGSAQLARLSLTASDYGIGMYKHLKSLTKGTGLEVHHLIEKRFAKVWGEKADEMMSIVLTKEEHAAFTKAWREAIPYSNSGAIINTSNVTKEFIIETAREIYKDHPVILEALGL